MDKKYLKVDFIEQVEDPKLKVLDMPELDTTGWSVPTTFYEALEEKEYIRRLILLGYTQKQAKHIAHYNKRKYGILTVEQLYHY